MQKVRKSLTFTATEQRLKRLPNTLVLNYAKMKKISRKLRLIQNINLDLNKRLGYCRETRATLCVS